MVHEKKSHPELYTKVSAFHELGSLPVTKAHELSPSYLHPKGVSFDEKTVEQPRRSKVKTLLNEFGWKIFLYR